MSITYYPPFGASPDFPLNVSLGGTNTDAFGRLRTSVPYTLFDSQNRYAADNQFDTSTATGGSITHLPNESTVRMDVTTSSGSEVVRQTYRSFSYQSGKGLLVFATFVMNAAKTNLRQRVGYFGSQNGIYFQLNDSTKSFVLRTYIGGSVDDTTRKVDQSSWNGDKLDGTGPSGLTLDLTAPQILWTDIEWLGVGSVRCGFIINGKFYVCHTFHTSNITGFSAVYMTTATLPVRYEITNTGTTASASYLKQICSSVMSEGGYEQYSPSHIARRLTKLSNIQGTFLPLVSIRMTSSTLGAVIIPGRMQVLPTTSQEYEVGLFQNSTLTGASWSAVASDSNVEQDTSATAMTGGTLVQTDYVSSSGSGGIQPLVDPAGYNWAIQLGTSIAGVSDILTLAIRLVDSTTPQGSALGAIAFWDLTQ